MVRKKSSEEVINSSTFQRDFRNIAQKVHSGEAHYIVKISGLPVMAVIPIEEYEELVKEREEGDQEREERLRQFRDAARRVGEKIEALGLTEEELDAQVTAARAEFHRNKKLNEPKAE